MALMSSITTAHIPNLCNSKQTLWPSFRYAKSCSQIMPHDKIQLHADIGGGLERNTMQPKTVTRMTMSDTSIPAASIESPVAEAIEQKVQYHFLVANAKFMLDDEEHLQELLRERLRLFAERNKKQDFWLVIEPKFLENFPEFTKRLERPAVAIISTDSTWITFMKLRLDRVLKGTYESTSFADATSSKPVNVEFDKPKTWTAPYPKYEGYWWTPFLPPIDS